MGEAVPSSGTLASFRRDRDVFEPDIGERRERAAIQRTEVTVHAEIAVGVGVVDSHIECLVLIVEGGGAILGDLDDAGSLVMMALAEIHVPLPLESMRATPLVRLNGVEFVTWNPKNMLPYRSEVIGVSINTLFRYAFVLAL